MPLRICAARGMQRKRRALCSCYVAFRACSATALPTRARAMHEGRTRLDLAGRHLFRLGLICEKPCHASFLSCCSSWLDTWTTPSR
jgi:hypothetical protein